MSEFAYTAQTEGFIVRVELPRENLERDAPGEFSLVLLPDDARNLADELIRAAQEIDDAEEEE